MKKTYIKPVVDIHDVRLQSIIAISLGGEADQYSDVLSNEDFGWDDDEISGNWKGVW